MITPIKALLAPAAIAAMTLAAASPALADGYGRGGDFGHERGWGQRENPRAAVAACSRVAAPGWSTFATCATPAGALKCAGG